MSVAKEAKEEESKQPAENVLAVVVARRHDGASGLAPSLQETLESLCGQTVPPKSVLVVDASGGGATEELAQSWGKPCEDSSGGSPKTPSPIVDRVLVPEADNFGQAVAAGLEDLSGPLPAWYWLVHDDMVPDSRALENLLSAAVRSSKIAVVGPKQVAYGDRSRLLSLGIDATQSGRRLLITQPGEIDQGQHDGREDVLAVGTAGMLVEGKAWRSLGGLDPALGPFGDGLEFGRRAHLADYRVVVAPDAIVEHAQAQYGHEGDGVPSFARRRAEQLYNWLLTLPAWLLLPTWLWLPFLTLGRAIVRFGGGQLGLARSEISGYFQVMAMTPQLLAARRRLAQTSTLPRGALASLSVDSRGIRSHRRLRRRIETHGQEEQVSFDEGALAQLRTHTLRTSGAFAGTILLGVALSFLAFYPYVSGVQGGSWGALPTEWVALRDQAFGGWQLSGSGSPGPANPLLAAMAVLTAPFALFGFSPNGVLTFFLFAALPLAAWGGWAIAGSLTRSPVVRFAVSGLWAASPTFWLPLIEGRMAAVVAYLAIAPAFVGLLRALRPAVALRAGGANDVVKIRVSDRAAWLAVGAFSTAVAAAAAPLAAPLIVVIALALALTGGRGTTDWHSAVHAKPPGLWGRLGQVLVVAFSAVAFIGPAGLVAARNGFTEFVVWLVSPTTSPTGVFSVLGLPNLPATVDSPNHYQEALQDGQFPTLVLYIGLAAAAVMMLWAVGVVAFSARRKSLSSGAVGFFAAGLVFLVATVAQSNFQVGGLGVPYLFLVFSTLFFLATISAGYSRYQLAAYAHKTSRGVLVERALRRTPSAIAATASFFAVGMALVVGPAGPFAQTSTGDDLASQNDLRDIADAPQSGALETTVSKPRNDAATLVGRPTRFIEPSPSPSIPHIALQGQTSDRRARLLTLNVSKRQVQTGLFRGDGIQLADLPTSTEALSSEDSELMVASSDLANAVAELTVYPSSKAVATLGDFAVDTLMLSASSPDYDVVIHTLDAVESLERVGSVPGGALWRVRPDGVAPSRAYIQMEEDVLPVESGPLDVDATVVLDSPGTLVLSETADPGWRATFAGKELEPTSVEDGSWRQAFDVPAGSGELAIRFETSYLKWWWGFMIAAGAILAVMAVPWRTRPAALLPIDNQAKMQPTAAERATHEIYEFHDEEVTGK